MAAPTDYRALPIKLRAQIAAVLAEPKGQAFAPKVLTAELTKKLQTANSTLRWLRQHGYASVLMIDLAGERPSILVERSAAPFLSRAGNGMTIKTDSKGVARYGYVLIAGCEVRWNERVN